MQMRVRERGALRVDGPSAKWGMCGSKVVVVVGGGMGYRKSLCFPGLD